MQIIVVAVLLATLAGFISEVLKRRHPRMSSITLFISAIILAAPLMLRGMGVDYDNYRQTYAETTAGNLTYWWSHYNGRPEPLYALLNQLSSLVFGSFQGVNVLCALLTIIPTYFGINYFKRKVNLGITIWSFGFVYYVYCYGLNRMMIAVALIFCTYKFFINRQYHRCFLLILIAALFHYSALVMIPIYLMMRSTMEKSAVQGGNAIKELLIVFVVFFLIYRLFPLLFGGFSWFQRYMGYFVLSFNASAMNNCFALYPLFVFTIFFNKKIVDYFGPEAAIASMLQLLIVMTLACTVMPIHRICYYLFPASIIGYGALPRIMSKTLVTQRDHVVFGLGYAVLLFCYGFFWLGVMSHDSSVWGSSLTPYIIGRF